MNCFQSVKGDLAFSCFHVAPCTQLVVVVVVIVMIMITYVTVCLNSLIHELVIMFEAIVLLNGVHVIDPCFLSIT